MGLLSCITSWKGLLVAFRPLRCLTCFACVVLAEICLQWNCNWASRIWRSNSATGWPAQEHMPVPRRGELSLPVSTFVSLPWLTNLPSLVSFCWGHRSLFSKAKPNSWVFEVRRQNVFMKARDLSALSLLFTWIYFKGAVACRHILKQAGCLVGCSKC